MADSVKTLSELRAQLLREALDDVTDRYSRSESGAERCASNILWDMLPAYRALKPRLSEDVKGRKLWDVALGSLRHVALEGPRAYFVSFLGGALGCSEVVEKARVLMDRSLELTRRGLQVHQAELKYDQAIEGVVIPADPGPGPAVACIPPTLVNLYASLKAFPEDTKVCAYVTQAAQYERLKLEVLVEGPLQLALSLSESGILAILRLPLWTGGLDEPNTSDLLEVVRACRERLQNEWESGWLRALVDIAQETIDLYKERLEDKLMAGRAFLKSPDARRRFVEAFEKGDYRVQRE